MAAVVVDSVEELWEREKVVWHDYSYYTDMEVRNIIGKLGKYFENSPSNVVAASAAEEITIPTGEPKKTGRRQASKKEHEKASPTIWTTRLCLPRTVFNNKSTAGMVEFCKNTFGRVISEVSTNQLLLISLSCERPL